MIVLDLDGTLTNNKKEITPRTKQALMQAQAAGVHVVLASGRPTYGIVPLAEELKLKDNGGYILAFNGGKISTAPRTKFFLNRNWTNSLYLSSFKKPKKQEWKS